MLVAMAFCILVSTRLTRRITSTERGEAFRPRWYEMLVAAGCIGLAFWNLQQPLTHGPLWLGITPDRLEIGLAAVLSYSSFHFYLIWRRRGSVAFWALSFSLLFWAVLLVVGQFKARCGGDLLGPVRQMLLGVSRVMVLCEYGRSAVQETAVASPGSDLE